MSIRNTSSALIIGASLVFVTACGGSSSNYTPTADKPSGEATAFRDIESCVRHFDRSGPTSVEPVNWTEYCTENYNRAIEANLASAPRYDSREVCEQQHGIGKCGGNNTSGNSNDWFMPFMAGYMVSSMFNDNGGTRVYNNYHSQPLYSTRSGSYSTANNSYRVSQNGFGRSQPVTNRQFRTATRPSPTQGKVQTKASVAKSGGFGASKTAKAKTSTSKNSSTRTSSSRGSGTRSGG